MKELEFWATRYQKQAQWTEQTRQFILKIINLPPQAKILEVGCGSLAVLKEYELDGHKTFGVDIDYSILNFANHQSTSKLINSDGYFLPFLENYFDLCFCHYLLLWLQEPIKLLQEMKRVTKKSGWICCFAEPDYVARIDSPTPLEKLGEVQNQSLFKQGIYLATGRHIAGWLSDVNLTDISWGIIGAHQTGTSQDNQENEWQTTKKDVKPYLSSDNLNFYRQIEIEAQSQGIRVLFIPTFYAYAKNNID